MAKVPNAVKILPKISTASVGHTSVTDDRRQADGRAIAYSEREREFTFAKKTPFTTMFIHVTFKQAIGPASKRIEIFSVASVIGDVRT